MSNSNNNIDKEDIEYIPEEQMSERDKEMLKIAEEDYYYNLFVTGLTFS